MKQFSINGQKTRKTAVILLAVLMLCVVTPVVKADETEKKDETQYLTILHTNDEHSALVPILKADDPEKEVGGIARLATAVNQIEEEKRAKNEPILLLSAGDFLGESAYGWLSTWGYAPELTLLQMIGYDAVTIGNHEYDFGPDILASYLQKAGYPEAHKKMPIVASNTQAPEDHPLVTRDLYHTSEIIELENGLNIGLFGLIGYDAISVASDTGSLVFPDPKEVAKQQVEWLKAHDVDLIVVLSHSGETEDIELARAVDGIDLIIGGHSHTLLSEPIQEGDTIIVQAGSQMSYLGCLELAVLPNGQLKLCNTDHDTPYVIKIDDHFSPEPTIQDEVDRYTDFLNEHIADMTGQFSDVHEPLVQSDFMLSNRPRMQETAVGNLVTDAMRYVTGEITGQPVDVAVMANGSIRGNLIPDSKNGTLSFYDITYVIGLGYGQDGYPGYSIASLYLTGEELRRVLEIAALLPEMMGDDYYLQFSGLKYRYNPQNTILFTIPFIDQPLPSTRAVIDAYRYTGDGVQPAEGDQFEPLERGDDKRYHLVTDTYILSFLPMAGELLPQLEIVPKNQEGEPVAPEHFHELTVPFKGRELKVWETVAMYVTGLQPDKSKMATIPDDYRLSGVRIVPAKSTPLLAVLLIILVVLVFAFFLLVRWLVRKLKRKKAKRKPV